MWTRTRDGGKGGFARQLLIGVGRAGFVGTRTRAGGKGGFAKCLLISVGRAGSWGHEPGLGARVASLGVL